MLYGIVNFPDRLYEKFEDTKENSNQKPQIEDGKTMQWQRNKDKGSNRNLQKNYTEN